ncbi:hypothetical protein [Deinococcus aquiradiocola]|uniref:Uncharacterized protein n=1 Tax=Deinococcus aquiradiocola TaxID=393059 RepID=A0A917P460_9DEIO|nr:hypothetical protein [Deinococcus aquiradiocola]GGJ60835.1 hypothetical protein GCM10008939_00740 [Deinococcus aquiradiocola]
MTQLPITVRTPHPYRSPVTPPPTAPLCPQAHAGTPAPVPAAPAAVARVFGTLFVEVILTGPLPALPGWHVRLWPQARLGDATLEACPEREGGADDLRAALQAASVQALGPVRPRR